jgi:hypothetical protein
MKETNKCDWQDLFQILVNARDWINAWTESIAS